METNNDKWLHHTIHYQNHILEGNYLKRINLNKSHNQKANTNTVTNALGHDYKRKRTDKDV